MISATVNRLYCCSLHPSLSRLCTTPLAGLLGTPGLEPTAASGARLDWSSPSPRPSFVFLFTAISYSAVLMWAVQPVAPTPAQSSQRGLARYLLCGLEGFRAWRC
eukprot:gnl/TRDRNA2_/TRDRNA2_77311_c1_seq1.p1 gnl/TRDRNA2_/TRDRNA2_77311_c1~~gnl/TRDRNA2_/TRDRNA2_77311_c1_seq1.p1  ORF type:complete len:105 (-),score=6.12 gnl/TRDRNA2_/TRDRNA2_77311_c1_seq1:153-467(-)